MDIYGAGCYIDCTTGDIHGNCDEIVSINNDYIFSRIIDRFVGAGSCSTTLL